MITILKYKIPEESEELEIAQNGWKYLSALHDFSNYLHTIDEMEREPTTEDIAKKFYDLLDAHRIDL